MKKKAIIAVAVVLSGLAAFLLTRFNDTRDEGILAVSGNVEVTEVNIGFSLPGRVIELLAEEGRKVRKGDRLAILDSDELESLVTQNKARLDETMASLEELETGARPQELEQARADVRHAEAELSMAEKDYKRADILFRNGAISAQQMDTMKKGYDVAVSRHTQAIETLSLVKEGPRKEAIKAARDRVRQAEAALKASEVKLDNTTIYAPISGVILRKNIEAGETVASGIPVYTIGGIDKPWIKVYVKEDKLGLVKLGQSAEASVDSFPGKAYKGTVTYISSEAEFTPKNVQTEEERVKLVFGVEVNVENENQELKPGMPADVRIIVNE